MPGFPLSPVKRLTPARRTFRRALKWDSRECLGPSSEALLSRPSTGRVLAAGALALAVSAPALEPAAPAEAQNFLTPIAAAAAELTPFLEARQRDRAASRSAVRGQFPTVRSDDEPSPFAEMTDIAQRMAEAERRLNVERAAAQLRAVAERRVAVQRRAVAAHRAVTQRAAAQRATTPRATTPRAAAQRAVAPRAANRRAVTPRATVRPRALQRAATGRQRALGSRARMASVVAFARSQVGKRYSRGGEGPHTFDCSGFTKRAYAEAGLRLPHSSGGQAARARIVSRAAARPGDLVVGAGHVGVYMGRGMMIDAGNRRTGVVYRRLYAGLHIERF